MIHISADHLLGINNYALFHIAAVITGVAVAGIVAVKSKFGAREFAVIISSGILAMTIGSKLLMFDGPQWNYLFSEFHLPEENGKSTIGAILGLILGLWFAGRLLGKNGSVLNLFAMSLPLALAVQGFACLSAGCCHGELTNLPWGVSYGPGTRPFIEQQQIGLIPSDAITSLSVHPSQIYTILACLCIALIVWKTRSVWKSTAGNFMFSIILFLVYRVIEGMSTYSLSAREWMGVNTTLWKVLILSLFSSILIYQEWRARKTKPTAKVSRTQDQYYDLKIFSLALISFIVSIQFGDWFSPDEKILILLIIFPLSGLVLLERVMRTVMHINYIRTSMIIVLALVFMSQKADVPPGTPSSYTSLNLTSTFGQYSMDHLFNKQQDIDCGGDPYIWGDHVGYHHTYVAGGLGISRKKYYTQWQSTTLSLNAFGGIEKETPIYNPYPEVMPPAFKNTLWNINPQFQFDTRGFGMGLGLSMGNISFDKESKVDNLDDYTPQKEGRDFLLQTRLRFFSERYFFVELLGGFDAGATGEYNWQTLVGSRFNSNKYMLKGGIVATEHSPGSFVIKGEMLVAKNLFLSPQINFYKKNSEYDDYEGGGYRAVLGLEYRFYDKEKGKKHD